jgi:hypothetical protein
VPLRPDGSLDNPYVNRWWCPQHADQAAPCDLEPRALDLIRLPGGGFRHRSEDERATAAEQERLAVVAEAQRRREARAAMRSWSASALRDPWRSRTIGSLA